MARPKLPIPEPLSDVQRAVLTAMAEGTPLIAGQMSGKWVNSNVLRTLLKKQLVTVDEVTRVYRLTDLGRTRLHSTKAEGELHRNPCSAAS